MHSLNFAASILPKNQKIVIENWKIDQSFLLLSFSLFTSVSSVVKSITSDSTILDKCSDISPWISKMAHQNVNQTMKRPLYTSFGDDAESPSGSKKMKDDQQSPGNKKMKKSQLGEEDVFILEYVNNEDKGFSGILKQRYTDFIVNEIDLQGNIVRLTSTAPPQYPSEMEKPQIDESAVSILLSEEEIARIKEISELPEHKKENVEIDVSNMDKEQRTFLHKYIQWVSNKLNSNTVERDGKRYIDVNNKRKGRQEMRRTNSFRIKFLHFTVTKTNTDTSEMLFLLGKSLSRKVNKFTIAGSKDKRAITSQQVCCKYLNYADLRHVDLNRVKLGNYAYKDHQLNLGDLKGNHFRIAIREVSEPPEVVNKSLELLKENGFINYFGMQRFGNNPEAATHDVGRLLIQDNWRGAIQLILKPGPVNGPAVTIPKIQKVEYIKHKYFETRNAKLTLRDVDDPNFLKSSIEARILQGLARHGENAYLNALENINRNTATLYLHAYQSLIWNRVVSARIKKFGLKVLVGDLILENVESAHSENVTRKEPTDAVNEDEEDDEEEQEINVTYDIPSSKANVRAVTEEDVTAGRVTIQDVVYPTPGFDVKMPENEVGTWYYEFLKEDKLSLESFRKNVKLFTLGGSYRRMVLKVQDMSWSIVHYDTSDQDLQLSDVDVLTGKTIRSASLKTYTAVLVEFSLPPSVYATMALREVLKAGPKQYSSSQGKAVPSRVKVHVARTPDGDIDY